ncbi:MAG TPA: bifunctional demethylmenaquinone methyltransferase/2-methoxy-6-polyprenyl-1,4-benzoquinol methylase UbiE [Dysgonamonadaceae bacterium]|nr:bifunctional demethylmenaquinone methyltransferase/2-methoxy-6-polyprenyl-1,4-benzoquinol methylase UbiE [Dysgonamonadaceae bacterium]
MSHKSEKVTHHRFEDAKRPQVEYMFNAIASQYDSLNSWLSFGLDKRWRKRALRKIKNYPVGHMLDIAIGTGDSAILAYDMLQPEKITGVDISDGMMDVGRKKVKKAGLEDVISFQNEDCASMTFPDGNFDSVITIFGVRNFENIENCFEEILRVLKPGGVFMFLELTTPRYQPIKFFYNIYSKSFIPFITHLLTKDKSSHGYLPQSIKAFPLGREMMKILEKIGFSDIKKWSVTMGVCTIFVARKAEE